MALGLNGNAFKFTADPTWTRKTDYNNETYYYSPMSSYTGTTQSFSFNITIDPTTKPDYYLLNFQTGIYQNPVSGQVGIHGLEQFYIQVVPEPVTLTLLGLGAGVLAVSRRCRRPVR